MAAKVAEDGVRESHVDPLVSDEQRAKSRRGEAPSALLANRYSERGVQSARVVGFDNRGSGKAKYTAYIVKVKNGAKEWTVFRRYNQL
mmetsp:Transcript_21336/g.36414  ORF Transcript_21336/g.36414 Transcript_21336/m.36414 type:complete len:88 (-) Transcript_21336:20-283(-)